MTVIAQQRLVFKSQNLVGLLDGDRGTEFHFQTINGLQQGKWFAGVGTGLDYYRYRTIPLFVSVNRNFTNTSRSFFISMDGGINFPWVKSSQWNDFISSDFSAALYGAAGLGYKIGLRNNKDAVILNIGYSFKQLKEKQEQQRFCINLPCPPSIEHYNYRMNRLAVRLGWQF